MLRRAAGYTVPDSEFNTLLEPMSGEESDPDRRRRRRPSRKRLSLDKLDLSLKTKPEWTMRNEGSDLESSDEEVNDGNFGSVYTMAEQRIMAKYIATYTVSEWESNPMSKKIWEPIMHKVGISTGLMTVCVQPY